MQYQGLLFRHRLFAVIVLLPTLIAALYFGLIASDVYVSESRFVVKNQNGRSMQVPSIASLIQTSGISPGQEQTNEVLDYVRSRSALKDLEQLSSVKSIYQNPAADRFSRYPSFWQDDRFENLYRYYSHMVDARLDTETGVAVLDVKAFTPQDAARINALLLQLSEQLVNRLNQKARQNAIEEAERHVAMAEKRAKAARLAMAKYRNQTDLIDPTKQAVGVLDISNKLVAQQAALQAQLSLIESVTPQNPSIPSLKSRISAIGREIDAQNSRAVGSNGAISSKLAGYEDLQLEQEFASQALTAANTSLEQASIEAAQQEYYLERVVDPNVPDMALLPHRLGQVLTVAAAMLCLYFIGWMLMVGILEHAPED